jgi:hypothetical protein
MGKVTRKQAVGQGITAGAVRAQMSVCASSLPIRGRLPKSGLRGAPRDTLSHRLRGSLPIARPRTIVRTLLAILRVTGGVTLSLRRRAIYLMELLRWLIFRLYWFFALYSCRLSW